VLDRPAPPPDLTVRYGDHPDQIIDVRRPPVPGPLVIFIHGGFWRHEYDRQHTGPLASALAGAGFVVATPEYRRTGGDGGWPTTLDDVAAAVSAAPALIRAAGVAMAGAEVALAGHSAGGHLALWAAAGADLVTGVVALAPVADLRTAYELDLDGGAVRALVGGGPDDVPQRYAAADPLARLPLGVRVEILHGVRDRQVPIALSRRYAKAALAAGDPVALTELDCDHFAVIDPISTVWPSVVDAFHRGVREQRSR
jgi:acetyl esterase/lipase